MNRCLIALFVTLPLLAKFDSHWLEHIAPAAKRIEIEDRSIWYIAPHSRHVAGGWERGDELQIYPNLDTFSNSSFPYYIKNKRKSSSPAATTLQLGPEKASSNATWIHSLDLATQQVITQNGQGKITYWQVEPKDLEMLSNWKSLQGVVVGNNEGLFSWWYSSCTYILINVNKAEWIRVEPLH